MSFAISPGRVAALLGQTPVSSRLGLVAPDARLRERSAALVAEFICTRIDQPLEVDANQLRLPL